MIKLISHILVLHVAFTCRQTYLKVLKGYRCVTHTEIFTNISDISQQLCTWYCLKDDDCNVMKYSLAGRSCHLSPEKCQYFHIDMGYVVFSTNIDTCLRWASVTEVNMDSAIGSQRVNKPGQLFVARGKFNGDMIPGKYADGRARHTLGGAQVIFDEPEILIIRDGCTVEWVLYDSATLDPFPTGAVVGGWLQGVPLYVARKYQRYFNPNMNGLSVGYYNKAAGLGHVGWGDNDVTMTSMDILVLRDWDHDVKKTHQYIATTMWYCKWYISQSLYCVIGSPQHQDRRSLILRTNMVCIYYLICAFDMEHLNSEKLN